MMRRTAFLLLAGLLIFGHGVRGQDDKDDPEPARPPIEEVKRAETVTFKEEVRFPVVTGEAVLVPAGTYRATIDDALRPEIQLRTGDRTIRVPAILTDVDPLTGKADGPLLHVPYARGSWLLAGGILSGVRPRGDTAYPQEALLSPTSGPVAIPTETSHKYHIRGNDWHKVHQGETTDMIWSSPHQLFRVRMNNNLHCLVYHTMRLPEGARLKNVRMRWHSEPVSNISMVVSLQRYAFSGSGKTLFQGWCGGLGQGSDQDIVRSWSLPDLDSLVVSSEYTYIWECRLPDPEDADLRAIEVTYTLPLG